MGITKNGKPKGTLHYFHAGGEYENDPYKLLAATIVIQAIEDWRALVRARAWEDSTPNKHKNFNALRLFFNGEWCAFLLHDFDIEPAAILETLEKELQQAMQNSKKKPRKRVKYRA